MSDRTKEFIGSEIFIYLNEMQEFSQFPWFGKGDVVFVEQLLKESQDIDELRRFFGAYAYIAETIRD
jgi:hypothetical protein